MGPFPNRNHLITGELVASATGYRLETHAITGIIVASGLEPTGHQPSFVQPTTDRVTAPVRPVVSPR